MNKAQLKKRKQLLADLKRPTKLSEAQLKSVCAETLSYIDDLECRVGAYMDLLDTVVPCFDAMDKALLRTFKNLAVIMTPKKKVPARKATRPRRVVATERLH